MPVPAARSARLLVGAALLCALPTLGGCIGARVIYPVMPTGAELAEFQAAGPADVQSDTLVPGAMSVSGPYRIVAGDVLAVDLPPEVHLDTSTTEGQATPQTAVTVKCRVRDDGTVLLPMIKGFAVAGKTTSEIEQALSAAYADPKLLKEAPNVVVTVSEYKSINVAVIGAVNQPGTHALHSDQMTVSGALMAAAGIKTERGARDIKVVSQDEHGQTAVRSLSVLLDDIPLEDLALKGGETVVVEPQPERAFTVYGLVKRTGVFEYPPPRRFNLMQALATAGGVDENAAPRYATIYRKRSDGSVMGATFQIDGTALENGSNILIKDGDVIAVEHTQGSWLRQFFSQVFGFRASVNVSSSASPTL